MSRLGMDRYAAGGAGVLAGGGVAESDAPGGKRHAYSQKDKQPGS